MISAVGNGAWYTSWALFLTRSVHLTPVQVGLGMTVAGVCGVLCTPALGWLGDRVGARELFAVQLAVQGGAAVGYAAVHGMALFMLVTGVAQVAGSGSGGRATRSCSGSAASAAGSRSWGACGLSATPAGRWGQ